MNQIEPSNQIIMRSNALALEAPAFAMPETGRAPLLINYLRILLQRKWTVLGAIVGCLLIGIAITLTTTPQYQAVTVIEISREASQIVDIKGVEPREGSFDQEFYETQYGLLKSRSLAEDVARTLRLDSDAAFFQMYRVKTTTPEGRPVDPARKIEAAAQILISNLEIKPARLSRLVEIRFSAPDPLFAQRVTNTWASQFVKSNLERRFNATSYARDFLEKRLVQTRAKLEQSERDLVTYAGREGIVNIGGETRSSNGESQPAAQSLAAQEITSINQELARATSERIIAEQQYRQAQSGGDVQQETTSATIGALRARRSEVASDLAKLTAQFEPSYPPAAALRAQLEDIDRSLARETGRVRGAMGSTYREALGREQQLQARVAQLKGSMLDLRRRSIQYNIIQRDVDTSRALYEGLLQRYKEVGIAGGVGTNNVSIVDRAKAPTAPYRPRPFVNLTLALLAGLVLGAALALLLEQIDEGFASPDAVEPRLGVPVLGASPMTAELGLDELEDPKSYVSEAYSTVRTSLSFSTNAGVPRTLAVTSTRPAEGKTTSALAIALALARVGKRVLLIDADMRSPSVHYLLELNNKRGFSSILAGDHSLGEIIQKCGALSVIAAGPNPPNPAELLSGPELTAFIDAALLDFDHVLFDCPPVMGLADAPLIANRVNGVVFIIESRRTRARFAGAALERLRQAHAHILGAVLTKYDPKQNSLGYAYGSHYGYGYGYDYGKGRTPAA